MNEEKEMIGFYDGIVESLKAEAKGLSSKLKKCSENNELNMYVQLIKALRETLEIIKRYEWQLMYSSYRAEGFCTKQIAVWEQNYDGEIRNHKIWNVIDEKEGK